MDNSDGSATPGECAIVVSATFTAEGIQPGLAFWVRELGLDFPLRFAGYNQLFTQLLDPVGLFARNRGFNVALVRMEDWLSAGMRESAVSVVDAIRSAAASFPAQLIVAICPSTPEHAADSAEPERALQDGVADLAGVLVITPAELQTLYPVREPHASYGSVVGHLPYTPEYFAALATLVVRKIHAISAPPFKVIALDCDETLWAGICGEDGPHGVVIDAPRQKLQEYMVEKRRQGMLLALVSKNNEADVVQTFRAHPEMLLSLADFSALRINWDSKGANLASMAAELGLGLDSFILVDDNPKECSEARAAAPGVLALPLPARPEEIPDFLKHVWAFDVPRATGEDAQRAALYAQRAERARTQRAAGSLEEFLASLQLEIRIESMKLDQVSRAAQLTRRTNQMNFTCVRRTEAELQNLGESECLTVTLKDRFGDYGLIGVSIFRIERDALVIDTFLLSCRAMGRGVEHRMLARLGEIALERGLDCLEAPFISGRRNRPAALFLESLSAADPDGVFRFSARQAAAVEYRLDQEGCPLESTPVSKAIYPSDTGAQIDYVRIATEFRDVHSILDHIRGVSQSLTACNAGSVPTGTALERQLTELWAEVLNKGPVGIHDNFFLLGGESLAAVQLLSRVHQIYHVEISPELVYSDEFTVAELAKAIELKGIEQQGEKYEGLLQEIEGLSDTEVLAMLAREQDQGA